MRWHSSRSRQVPSWSSRRSLSRPRAAALCVARAVARVAVAEALRDRSVDLPTAEGGGGSLARALVALGIPLLPGPPGGELPLGGYAAIAAWLTAAVIAVAPLCRA